MSTFYSDQLNSSESGPLVQIFLEIEVIQMHQMKSAFHMIGLLAVLNYSSLIEIMCCYIPNLMFFVSDLSQEACVFLHMD